MPRPLTPPKSISSLPQPKVVTSPFHAPAAPAMGMNRAISPPKSIETTRRNTPRSSSQASFRSAPRSTNSGMGMGRSITPPRAITELTSHLSYDAKGNEHIRTAARTRLRELGAQRPITPPESITKASFKDDGQDLISIQMKAAQATAREARLSTPSKARDPAFHDRVRKELNKELTA